ncbi:2-dehydro-3-deoxygalactonokinase [Entomohabitans teleogrylli]|uniref:2-dehydro-3-deoxygalactonokinase n=1 Tax=Entomohabitans teleogrylli TaxID=1384589 RepID=UPI00073D7217|nr:2-dehydro-3-deoxygalactonokinase [Entomohabitans teleogrylli]
MVDSYIAVDWGSTHLRAWRWHHGRCVDALSLPLGIGQLGELRCDEVFDRHIAPWRRQEKIPVVMAGMIGSDAGGYAVDYLPCPVSPQVLSGRLHALAEGVWIVPGLKTERDGRCNVMRGEETQILGAMRLAPADCYVLPGTHCKWVAVDDGVVRGFDTAMTGELHHLLMANSLIGRGLPPQQPHDEVFARGLAQGLETPSCIERLFEARAARVLGQLAAQHVAEWLSGLLIGAEVRALHQRYRARAVTLVAGAALNDRYRRAFNAIDVAATTLAGDDAFQQGIRSIVDAGR